MRTTLRRVVAIPAVMLMTTAGVVGFTSTAAQAWPTGCQSGVITFADNSEGGWSYCSGGTGHYRAQVYCTRNPSTGYPYIWRFGQWRQARSGLLSLAACPSDYRYAVATATDSANW